MSENDSKQAVQLELDDLECVSGGEVHQSRYRPRRPGGPALTMEQREEVTRLMRE